MKIDGKKFFDVLWKKIVIVNGNFYEYGFGCCMIVEGYKLIIFGEFDLFIKVKVVNNSIVLYSFKF